MKNTPELHYTPNNVIAFYIMVGGLFMSILDIQIVASSLGEIQSALSASMDEISWIQTAYLMAEVVMIPVCGWLSEVFSTRKLFSVSACLFTLASAACAMSWNLESMIVFRVIQGFFAGALIPTVFSAIFIIFPPDKQSRASITAGLVATLAPTLGPTLGGWITVHFSWQWLFLINIVPGLLVTYGTYKYLDIDRPKLELLKIFDKYGLLFSAIALGVLELFLKKGQKNDWFDSFFITCLFVIIVVSFLAFLYRELVFKHPIVDLRAFRDINFSIGCFLSFAVGVGLFGAVYLVPMLLTLVKHYNSLQIGTVIFVAGMFQFASGPLAGKMEKFMDLRLMLFLGLFLMATGTFLNSYLTTDVSFDELFIPQAIRGISSMLCFLPMTSVTLSRLPKSHIKNASGLYNLMRNLGGAIGIAVMDTCLNSRIKIHSSHLSEFINSQKLNQVMGAHGHSFLNSVSSDPNYIQTASLKLTQFRIMQQSFILAFNDVFSYVGIYLFLCCLLVFFIKPIKKTAAIPGH